MRSNNNIRMALASIGAAKWRSFLTMLGVIIGVSSVITVVSLGEGVKHQLTAQINQSGADLITVRGGHLANYDADGKIVSVNLQSLFAGTALSDADYQTIQKIPSIQIASPFAVVAGIPKADDGIEDPGADIIATNEKGALALNQEVAYGSFYNEAENKKPVAVIGKRVAEVLFKENVPVGKTFELRGQKFTVGGVFRQFEASPLTPGLDYNHAIFIPYDYAKQMSPSPLQPYHVLVRPKSDSSIDAVVSAINADLTASHGGQKDFTVLKASDTLAVANNVLTLLTNLVSAIAAVSLLVGGIGIMNIMLVAVSERTYEVGIRKSIGATNRQILNQFLTEAMVLSTTGGILGVIASLLINYLLRIFSNLQPVITPRVMGIAVLVAVVVGIVAGITPALKAARKDPIEALRRV